MQDGPKLRSLVGSSRKVPSWADGGFGEGLLEQFQKSRGICCDVDEQMLLMRRYRTLFMLMVIQGLFSSITRWTLKCRLMMGF